MRASAHASFFFHRYPNDPFTRADQLVEYVLSCCKNPGDKFGVTVYNKDALYIGESIPEGNSYLYIEVQGTTDDPVLAVYFWEYWQHQDTSDITDTHPCSSDILLADKRGYLINI